MSMNVELRWVDLHLVGQDLNDSSDWGSILNNKQTYYNISPYLNPALNPILCLPATHRVVGVFWEELHLQCLFLLDCSAQKSWEEQQRSQSPQQVWTVPQHALTTAVHMFLIMVFSWKICNKIFINWNWRLTLYFSTTQIGLYAHAVLFFFTNNNSWSQWINQLILTLMNNELGSAIAWLSNN